MEASEAFYNLMFHLAYRDECSAKIPKNRLAFKHDELPSIRRYGFENTYTGYHKIRFNLGGDDVFIVWHLASYLDKRYGVGILIHCAEIVIRNK